MAFLDSIDIFVLSGGLVGALMRNLFQARHFLAQAVQKDRGKQMGYTDGRQGANPSQKPRQLL
jgi:hypothetical protein